MTIGDDNVYSVVSTPDDVGKRLDSVLARHLADLSRVQVQRIIQSGGVKINGHTIEDQRAKVAVDSVITIKVPPPVSAEPVAQDLPLSIVFEDSDVIVVDKPAGLVVHPGAGHASGTLVNALIAHCGDSLSGIGGVRRPGIVHRIDKDTSGLLVVAKNDLAHRHLSAQFAAHGRDGKLSRAYTALVWGEPSPAKGRIDAPLARSTSNRLKIAISRTGTGREAATNYEVKKRYGHRVRDQASTEYDGALVSHVELKLETGRTHQIRVHMTYLGHPLLGDAVYGGGFKTRISKLPEAAQAALRELERQALHAHALAFEHPRSGETLDFRSPLPADMQHLMSQLP